MNWTQRYNPHVIMDEMNLAGGPAADIILGVLLVLCGLIGTPGNMLALKYFLSTGRKDLAAILYMISCCCDFLISLVQYPTAIALFRGRAPGIFNSIGFCSFWNVFFFLLQKIAIFTVMVLSVSRTIAIVMPFYKVKKLWVLCILVIYAIALLVIEITGAVFRARFIYLSVGPFCLLQPDPDIVGRITCMLALHVGIPSVITFFSFIVSVVHLTGQRTIRGAQKRKKEASNTIAIFTGFFIFCNLPYCIILTLEKIRIHSHLPYPGPFLKNKVMFWYAWPVSSVVFIVLNSAINPVLYYMRMSEFKNWSNTERKIRISKLRQSSSIVNTILILKQQGRHSTSNIDKIRIARQQSQPCTSDIDEIEISKQHGWHSTGDIDKIGISKQHGWHDTSNNDTGRQQAMKSSKVL